MSTTTSNMSLTIPSSGDSDYPTSISNSLTTLDSHTHATGSGVQIPTGGIANGAITQAKRAALGQQVSSSCGVFSTSSTSLTDVTNLSISITTTGRPVFIGIVPVATAPLYSYWSVGGNCVGPVDFNFAASIALLRAASVISSTQFGLQSTQTPVGPIAQSVEVPVSFYFIEAPASGTYTYKIQALVSSFNMSTCSLTMNECKLIAYEL